MAEHFPDFQKKVDYISLDSVCLNKHVFYHPKDGIARNNGYDPADWAIRISDVMDVPAADVVEVVRCKDCTYFNHVKCQEERAGLCEHFDTYMYISDYCSDGYRRDDNG